MPVRRLNHAVLFVRDVERSVTFYREVLGFAPIDGMDGLRGAAFLRAPASTNDHDLGLFEIGAQAGPSGAGQSTVGLYHLAWEVETLADLVDVSQRLAGAQRPRRRDRPRHHQGALRPRPRRHRARGELAGAGRPADAGDPRRSATSSSRWTCRPRSSASAPTPSAASASRCPR